MDCIIVDDSAMARQALKLLIDQVDSLTLKKECENSLEAFNYLKANPVDLVFLDVEMPGMTGVELVKNLKTHPIIIFVTSKKEYAVEAFELNVADYIVKPVTLSRFMLAIEKAQEIADSKDKKIEINEKEKDYIFVRSNSALTKINLDEVLYVQAMGDYVNIFSGGKRHVVHCTLKSMEEKLPLTKFFRAHRSYLVALDQIEQVEENTIYIGEHPIPIGEQYKKELLKRINLI